MICKKLINVLKGVQSLYIVQQRFKFHLTHQTNNCSGYLSLENFDFCHLASTSTHPRAQHVVVTVLDNKFCTR